MKFSASQREIIAIFNPPTHEDERLNFLVGIGYYSIGTVFALTLYFALTLSDADQLIGRSICGALAIATFISLIFMKRGYFTIACCLAITFAYVSSIVSAILNQGVSSVPMQALAPIFLLVLTFMQLRCIFLFGGFTLLSIGFMSWLDSIGYYAAGHGPIAVRNPGVVSAGILLATCFVIYIVVKNSIGNSQNLIDAKMMAEEQNRLKNKYFATMTHELRTPLNAIIGYSEDIIDIDAEDEVGIDSEVFENVTHIHTSGRYLLALINDILDISKIEAEGMDIYVNQFSGLDLINEIYATVYPIAKQNGNILISGQEFDQKIATDRQKLRQILINLLSNAAKFTQNGEIHLRFSVIDGDQYQFEISDTGVGIPSELMPQLFDSFSQARNAKSTFKGTGLGLSITKRLTELLGGELAVESQINVGTTFTLRLPKLAVSTGESAQLAELTP